MAALLNSLVKGKEFPSFEEMEVFFEGLIDENFFPLKVNDSRTISSYNKALKKPLDLKWKYKYVDITCSHFGEHKSRSKGVRPNQKVYANECPFRVRVVFKPDANKFVVENCCVDHSHPISQEHFALYRRNSKLKGAARLFALSSLSVGANPSAVQMELQKNFGVMVKAKDLQNLKQGLSGLASNDWSSTCDLLVNLTNNPENLVNVITDEHGNIKCIFVQLAEQRRLYAKFGEVVQIDATHGVTDTPMPLYTLLVTDNFGVGQPVAFFFVKEETTENITIGLKQFSENNEVAVTKVVVTDKDCGEIAAIKETFPHATHLLCLFHALKTVDRRLDNKNGLTQSEISEIYGKFHAAVYAKTREEFEDAKRYLTSIEHDNIGKYFEKNWFCEKWIKTWPTIERREICTLGDDTTNKIERYHRTIKEILQKKGKRFSTVIKTLLDIVTQRLLIKHNKELELEIRFPTMKLTTSLEELRTIITPKAFDLVLQQSQKPTTSYQLTRSNNEYTVTSKSGMFSVSLDYVQCSCWFSKNYKLPCSHTVFAHQKCGGSWPTYARWSAHPVLNTEPLQGNALSPVKTVVGPTSRKRNAKQAINELNMVLQSISTTVQGFPVPVLCGCINMLRSINNRWRANVPTDLGDDGVTLAFLDEAFNAFLDEGIARGASSNVETSTDNGCSSAATQPSTTSDDCQASSSTESSTSDSCSTSTAEPSTSRSSEDEEGRGEETPRTALKRKLETFKLPAKKSRVGRPTKKKALDHHHFVPKCFSEKPKMEQARMVITWVAGAANADKALQTKTKLDQDQIKVRPEDVSTALIEEDLELETFKEFFDEEAWSSVVSLVSVMKNLEKQKKLTYVCHECDKKVGDSGVVFCNSCREWLHFKCEGLKQREPISTNYFCKHCYSESKK